MAPPSIPPRQQPRYGRLRKQGLSELPINYFLELKAYQREAGIPEFLSGFPFRNLPNSWGA